MMLLNDFYTIKSLDVVNETIEACTALNAKHPIFGGHFPEVAIVPGVCLVQIIREIVEQHTKQKLVMNAAANIKFLNFVKPDEVNELTVRITVKPDQDAFKTDSVISAGKLNYFKMNAEFKEITNF